MRASKTLPEARKEARALEDQADGLEAEAEALKGAVRLEDLSVWVMEKTKTTKERQQEIRLLDGLMERGRKSAQCPSEKLREGGSRGSHEEG